MDQLVLPLANGNAHARLTDPISSEKAVTAIARDGSLARLICNAVVNLTTGSLPLEPGVTDDDLLEYIESTTSKRQQRNVIARARGLLERDGWLLRVPADRVSVVPTDRLLNAQGTDNE